MRSKIIAIKNWLIAHKREVVLLALIFLISTLSIAVGFLMAKDTSRAPIIIEKGI